MRSLANSPRRRFAAAAVVALTAALGAAGCSGAVSTAATQGSSLFDTSTVHSVSVEYDEDEYAAMIDTLVATGEKDWISATVTIDGVVFDDVGIKLKGNSSLRGLTADSGPGAGDAAGGDAAGGVGGPGGSVSADEPEGLPWRIRLDKYVEGQNHLGETDFVVRGNNSETSLDEAVALELLDQAGMPSQEATYVRFTVNGSDETLRLAIEMPDDAWYEDNFDSEGILYKAEAEGDYSYRGDDPASYEGIFDIDASTTGEDDYTPLIEFLAFLDSSDDATFATELGQHLDVEAFADYLAIQDLLANADDIDGPGNNSYLRYDAETGIFTVVTWDENLAFGGLGGGFGQPGAAPGRDGVPTRPDDGNMPEGFAPPSAGGGRGGMMGGNVLSERFLANADFAALVETAKEQLQANLYDSGTAQGILDTWTALLTDQASDLVDANTITSEAAQIAEYFG